MVREAGRRLEKRPRCPQKVDRPPRGARALIDRALIASAAGIAWHTACERRRARNPFIPDPFHGDTPCPKSPNPPTTKANFLVDYEEKVFEDVKAEPGEKALVTFHTVAFEGLHRLREPAAGHAPAAQGALETSMLLYGPGVTLGVQRGFPTLGDEAFPGHQNFNKQIVKFIAEGGKVYACRFALQALYGHGEGALIDGIRADQPARRAGHRAAAQARRARSSWTPGRCEGAGASMNDRFPEDACARRRARSPPTSTTPERHPRTRGVRRPIDATPAAKGRAARSSFPETFLPYYPYFSFVQPPVQQGPAHLRL